jgi:hypothetical protein
MYVGSSDTALLSGMSSDTPLPLNLSSSWYWGANPSGDDPYFEKMAAQGQTYFEASGDSGGYTETLSVADEFSICQYGRRHQLNHHRSGRRLVFGNLLVLRGTSTVAAAGEQR